MQTKATGFASPALGYEEQGIDLNRLLITNPPATYFVRMDSSDMAQLGLPRGTLLVVNRAIDPVPGSFVLIRHEGQFLCRLFSIKPENGKAVFTDGKKEIEPLPDETEVFGTITASIQEYQHAISY